MTEYQDAATTLRNFGASTTAMLDGGGTTNIVIATNRSIPHALAIAVLNHLCNPHVVETRLIASLRGYNFHDSYRIAIYIQADRRIYFKTQLLVETANNIYNHDYIRE